MNEIEKVIERVTVQLMNMKYGSTIIEKIEQSIQTKIDSTKDWTPNFKP